MKNVAYKYLCLLLSVSSSSTGTSSIYAFTDDPVYSFTAPISADLQNK